MYQEHGAVHHTDVTAGATISAPSCSPAPCRWILASPRQRSLVPPRRLQVGPRRRSRTTSHVLAERHGADRNGWLHALMLVRQSSDDGLEAEYMISGVRDHALALACLRNGVSPNQGRGVDSLTSEVKNGLTGALVCSLKIAELKRAFSVACQSLLAEAGHVDDDLAGGVGWIPASRRQPTLSLVSRARNVGPKGRLNSAIDRQVARPKNGDPLLEHLRFRRGGLSAGAQPSSFD